MPLSTPSDFIPEFDASDVPAEYRREFLDIVALTDGFCSASLTDEYRQLCRTMATSICQAGFLRSRLEDNPLVWMIEINGFIIDMRLAPREMQIAAYEDGLIPYVPSEQPDEDEDNRPPK